MAATVIKRSMEDQIVTCEQHLAVTVLMKIVKDFQVSVQKDLPPNSAARLLLRHRELSVQRCSEAASVSSTMALNKAKAG
eukprot:3668399-Pleurochrysis_carterae.AAC.3